MQTSLRARPVDWLPLSFGVASASIAVIPDVRVKMAIGLPVAALAFAWWSILSPGRWLMASFLCALLTPPIAIPGFENGVQLTPAFAVLGLVAGAVRMPEWQGAPRALTVTFALFTAMLACSAGVGALYSGADAGIGSLARAGLFAIGVYVFFYACAGPRETGYDSMRVASFLFLAGVAAALFACADFYYHFPAPSGFGQQFVWLDEGVFRRAQGFFYEASTLGNFCSFLLLTIAVAASRGAKELPLSYPVLAAGGIVAAAALMLSYSRGSLVNLIVSCVALALLRRVRVWRAIALAGLMALIAIVAVRAVWPSFSDSYWTRITGSVQFFMYSPNGVLSGRIGNWSLLTDFLVREPWQCLFGIGYKTLPYFGLAGNPLIADNNYLDLLVETGVTGLAVFLALNFCILRAAWRAAHSSQRRAVFFGEWIFCFWIGEMVQMLSGDLITYWRVLPVYFWVLGTAIRETKESV